LVLPSAHLSIPLGLGQGEAEECSFSSTFMLHIVNNAIMTTSINVATVINGQFLMMLISLCEINLEYS
jgi:hypothetical protein